MRLTKIVQNAFGGAFLGIAAVKAPSAIGFTHVPTHRVELIASLLGAGLAVGVSIMDALREKKAREPLKLGR